MVPIVQPRVIRRACEVSIEGRAADAVNWRFFHDHHYDLLNILALIDRDAQRKLAAIPGPPALQVTAHSVELDEMLPPLIEDAATMESLLQHVAARFKSVLGRPVDNVLPAAASIQATANGEMTETLQTIDVLQTIAFKEISRQASRSLATNTSFSSDLLPS